MGSKSWTMYAPKPVTRVRVIPPLDPAPPPPIAFDACGRSTCETFPNALPFRVADSIDCFCLLLTYYKGNKGQIGGSVDTSPTGTYYQLEHHIMPLDSSSRSQSEVQSPRFCRNRLLSNLEHHFLFAPCNHQQTLLCCQNDHRKHCRYAQYLRYPRFQGKHQLYALTTRQGQSESLGSIQVHILQSGQ